MGTKRYIPIAGTQARDNYTAKDRWFQRGSLFDQKANEKDCERVEQNNDPNTPDPGYWSGDLAGLLYQSLWTWVQSFSRQDPHPWDIGAHALATLIQSRAEKWQKQGDSLIIIAHSHGGQVACLALKQMARKSLGFPIHLITVDMPVRCGWFLPDMCEAYEATRRHVDQWTHLYSDRMNPYRAVGSRFGPLKCKQANDNIRMRGGHTNPLVHPIYMDQVINLL